MLMARAVARPRSLHRADQTGSIETRAEMSARVETPRVESSKLEPVKSDLRPEPPRPETTTELRRSTD
jgi:hypothetical protein